MNLWRYGFINSIAYNNILITSECITDLIVDSIVPVTSIRFPEYCSY